MRKELLPPARWISASTAARLLNVERPSVTRFMHSGLLTPVTHIDHGKHRVPIFDRVAVEKLREAREAAKVGGA